MFVRIGVAAVLSCGLLLGQSPAAPARASGAAAKKPLAFEVVSIRQNVADREVDAFGATPDGFRMVNVSLPRLILTAYVPQSGAALFWEPKGFPAWVGKDSYDIEARVAEADRPQWQNSALQPEMMRAMLQQLLADRCHLAVHRVFEDAPVYYLEVGKGGPKFKPSDPSHLYPPGEESRFPGGGVVVGESGGIRHFYGAPMTLLASFLTNMNLGGRPVEDRTGLTGRYDFLLPSGWTAGMTAAPGEASDPGPTLFSAVEGLGLKLVGTNGQVENLVLDHIERPSEN
jgi:uncharacterized protein (TIGR03435 family)